MLLKPAIIRPDSLKLLKPQKHHYLHFPLFGMTVLTVLAPQGARRRCSGQSFTGGRPVKRVSEEDKTPHLLTF